MIAMALTAFRPVVVVEGLLVLAAVEQAGVGGVAETATVAHTRDPGRTGGMVSMTVVTGRCTEVAATE
jgi:hypothetical protein